MCSSLTCELYPFFSRFWIFKSSQTVNSQTFFIAALVIRIKCFVVFSPLVIFCFVLFEWHDYYYILPFFTLVFSLANSFQTRLVVLHLLALTGSIFLFFELDLSCSAFKTFLTGESVRIGVCLFFLPLVLLFLGLAFRMSAYLLALGMIFEWNARNGVLRRRCCGSGWDKYKRQHCWMIWNEGLGRMQ